jgi:single-strand DNA-binding protein
MSVDFYSFNQVILCGRVMKKSPLRKINGQDLIHISLGTREVFYGPKDRAGSEQQKKKPTGYYHDISAWAKTAWFINTYIGVSDTVLVKGRLRTYPNKEGVWKTIVQADSVIIMGRRSRDDGAEQPPAEETRDWDNEPPESNPF